MNKVQKNQQVMGTSVSETATSYGSVWAGSELFTGTVQAHNENLITVKALEVKQNQTFELHGLVRDKNLLRTFIIAEANPIVAAIKGYAVSANNQMLYASVSPFTNSKLKKLSDTKFATAIQTIKEIATTNAANILPFGITAIMITDFGGDCAAFAAIAPKPKALRAVLKMFTSQLGTAVKAMLTHLKENMDNQVKSLYSNTDFFTAYFNSRKIYNYNETVTGIRGTIRNADTGHAMRNVIVELVGYPTPEQNGMRITNAAGNYAFKKISLTTATLRFRAIGFVTSEFEVNVVEGKLTDFDIELAPATAPVPVTA